MPVREIGEVLVDQRGEHPPLVVGDDAVGDPRKLHRREVGRARLDHEDHGGDDAERDDPRQVLVDVGRLMTSPIR